MKQVRLLSQPDRSTYTGTRDVALIAFLADTGLRVSEALAVRFTDIESRSSAVSVLGKGGTGRSWCGSTRRAASRFPGLTSGTGDKYEMGRASREPGRGSG